jgi:hypothetical protein
MGDGHPAVKPDADPPADEQTDLPDSASGSIDAGTAKIRRSRVRARKAARTAAEPTPDSAPVTWIQVGPGRFVRVEGGTPTALKTNAQDVVADAGLETDAPVDTPPTVTAPADAMAVHDPLDLPVTAPGGVGMVFEFEDPTVGPAIEEYGIAPSAFNPTTAAGSSVEHTDDAVPGVAVHSGSIAELGDKTTRLRVDPGYSEPQRPTWKGRPTGIPRGIASAIASVAPVGLPLNVPASSLPHFKMRSQRAPNARLQHAMRRALGRIAHFQRTHQPRSPPFDYGCRGRPALPAGTCREFARGGTRPVEPARRSFVLSQPKILSLARRSTRIPGGGFASSRPCDEFRGTPQIKESA